MAAHALIGSVHSRPRGDWRRMEMWGMNTVTPRKIGSETFFRYGGKGKGVGSRYE